MRTSKFQYSFNKPLILSLVLITLFSFTFLIVSFFSTSKVSAAYDGARIIDNSVFLDAGSMSTNDIQNFLVARGGGIANMSFQLNCYGPTSLERQWYTAAGAPCDQIIPASQIIYYAAQIYGVNPRVILATMQKEQSLVTAVNPTSWQINQAMGYGCPTTGQCGGNSTFFYQIDSGTWVLRYHYERARGNMTWWNTSTNWTCGTPKNYYTPNLYPEQNVSFYDEDGVLYRTYFIANAATSAFYCYTPHAYNNPQGLYGRPPFGTVGRYYSGSYNFVLFYELWFGTTQAFVHEGINYGNVFDPDYYLDNNNDVRQVYGNNPNDAFRHFLDHGMREGRKGNDSFDVVSYRNRHQDLRINFRNNLVQYYKHYTTYGKSEGRIATGSFTLVPITSFGGKSYSAVYNYYNYLDNNADIRQLYANDDAGAIEHFVMYGMNEARIASQTFNAASYRGHYFDLRRVFGADMKQYYLHFIHYGQGEGRDGTGSFIGGTTILNNIDFSSIYQFSYYRTVNSDILTAFQLDDVKSLQHFINFGMKEGRRASSSFNVDIYKDRYPDLRATFGNNTEAYYWHYLYYGRLEGRTGA